MLLQNTGIYGRDNWSYMTLWQDRNAYITIKPHRSTTYVDAAFCYRPSSVVCLFVCQSVTVVSSAKMGEPIEMPFGLRTRVYPGNHVLDGGPDHGKGQFWEKGAAHCKV